MREIRDCYCLEMDGLETCDLAVGMRMTFAFNRQSENLSGQNAHLRSSILFLFYKEA